MADYKKMYLTMMHGTKDAIHILIAGKNRFAAVNRLIQAQRDCEELYISTADDDEK